MGTGGPKKEEEEGWEGGIGKKKLYLRSFGLTGTLAQICKHVAWVGQGMLSFELNLLSRF